MVAKAGRAMRKAKAVDAVKAIRAGKATGVAKAVGGNRTEAVDMATSTKCGLHRRRCTAPYATGTTHRTGYTANMKIRHATRKAVAWEATASTIASPSRSDSTAATTTESATKPTPIGEMSMNRSKAKAARTDTGDTTEPGGAADDANNAEDTDKSNEAIMERWYGMRGNKTEISIDLSLLHAVSPAPLAIETGDLEMTDAPAVEADTRAWESSTTIDDSAIGKAQNTGPEMRVVDEESEINRLQMDSGCCTA
jgi:hypothetical protein